MANFITGIISITIGIVVLASLFMTTLKTTVNSTRCISGWNGSDCVGGNQLTTGEYALYGLIGLVAIAGILYGVLNIFGIA